MTKPNFFLTKDDFKIYGDKVKLEIWLRKHEMDEILENQEIAKRLDKRIEESKPPYYSMNKIWQERWDWFHQELQEIWKGKK
jgi:hypothetical protein